MKQIVVVVLALVMMATTVVPSAHAQENDLSEITGFSFAEGFGELTCADVAVYRDYTASDAGLEALFTGQPLFLSFMAFDYLTEEDGEEAMHAFRERVGDGYLSFSSDTIDLEIRPVSIGSLGEESSGFAIASAPDEASEIDVDWSLVFVAVRQGPVVALGIGIGTTGSVGELVDAIEPTLTDWPTGEWGAFASGIRRTPDGEMTGGLFDALPLLEHMPVGFGMAAQGTVLLSSPARGNCR